MTASALPMVGAFAYVGGRATALAYLAACLAVLPTNVIDHAESEVDYSFYAGQESCIGYSLINGDFL